VSGNIAVLHAKNDKSVTDDKPAAGKPAARKFTRRNKDSAA
jgi:hypothetical protein